MEINRRHGAGGPEAPIPLTGRPRSKSDTEFEFLRGARPSLDPDHRARAEQSLRNSQSTAPSVHVFAQVFVALPAIVTGLALDGSSGALLGFIYGEGLALGVSLLDACANCCRGRDMSDVATTGHRVDVARYRE